RRSPGWIGANVIPLHKITRSRSNNAYYENSISTCNHVPRPRGGSSDNVVGGVLHHNRRRDIGGEATARQPRKADVISLDLVARRAGPLNLDSGTAFD